MLMTFLGMKLKVTQNRRGKGRVCRMLPFPLCITVRRLVTIPTAWGNFAHAHIVITNWLIELKMLQGVYMYPAHFRENRLVWRLRDKFT